MGVLEAFLNFLVEFFERLGLGILMFGYIQDHVRLVLFDHLPEFLEVCLYLVYLFLGRLCDLRYFGLGLDLFLLQVRANVVKTVQKLVQFVLPLEVV